MSLDIRCVPFFADPSGKGQRKRLLQNQPKDTLFSDKAKFTQTFGNAGSNININTQSQYSNIGGKQTPQANKWHDDLRGAVQMEGYINRPLINVNSIISIPQGMAANPLAGTAGAIRLNVSRAGGALPFPKVNELTGSGYGDANIGLYPFNLSLNPKDPLSISFARKLFDPDRSLLAKQVNLLSADKDKIYDSRYSNENMFIEAQIKRSKEILQQYADNNGDGGSGGGGHGGGGHGGGLGGPFTGPRGGDDDDDDDEDMFPGEGGDMRTQHDSGGTQFSNAHTRFRPPPPPENVESFSNIRTSTNPATSVRLDLDAIPIMVQNQNVADTEPIVLGNLRGPVRTGYVNPHLKRAAEFSSSLGTKSKRVRNPNHAVPNSDFIQTPRTKRVYPNKVSVESERLARANTKTGKQISDRFSQNLPFQRFENPSEMVLAYSQSLRVGEGEWTRTRIGPHKRQKVTVNEPGRTDSFVLSASSQQKRVFKPAKGFDYSIPLAIPGRKRLRGSQQAEL